MGQEVVENIQSLLFQVSDLTDIAEKNASDFFAAVKQWLKSIEQALIKGRIAAGAQIAAYRGIMISVDRDGIIPEGLVFLRTPSRIKLRNAAAMIFLSKSVEIIYNYLATISVVLGNSNRNNISPSHLKSKHDQ